MFRLINGGMGRGMGRGAAMVTAAGMLGSAAAMGAGITNVGVPAGGSSSGVQAISSNGLIAGVSVDPFGSTPIANRWASGAGLTGLSALNGSIGGAVEDVNQDGTVFSGSALYEDFSAHAVRWTAAGVQDLGLLSGGSFSVGTGISRDGSTVTGSADDGETVYAFRWTSAGGMQSLGTMTGGTYSDGRRVNGDGSVVVGVGDTADGDRAFRWTSAGGMQSLGTLTPDDTWSSAFGVNGAGNLVVGFSGTHAAMWNGGVAQDLGVLPGADQAIAYTVSDDGSVVGGYNFFGSSARATLWLPGLGQVLLSDYLPTLGVDLTGWNLQYTRDVSADGLTIVGEGTFNGQSRGWVVTIPSPGAAGVLGAGVLVAMRRRRG